MNFKYKILAVLLCSLLANNILFAQVPMSSFADSKQTISLNGNWKFALAKNKKDVQQLINFFQPGFSTAAFSQIPVPSNWAVLGYEEPVYRGFEGDTASEGFYLHDFALPKQWNGKRLLLHFGGVWSMAEVWINGIYIGQHKSGYTSFAFDVTGKFKTDSINTLAVSVQQVSSEYKFDVYDDWTLGGIFRDVTLEALPPKRWIDYATATTVFDNNFKDADLEVKCMVTDKHEGSLPGNYPSPGNPYDLRFTLLSSMGEKVAERQITVPAHTATSRETQVVFKVQTPLQWTAETPNLYHLQIELLENGKTSQTKTEQIGFRQISVAGGIFRINGQSVKLRGVNRHDEHPDVGRATTHANWLEDILLMKAANINYIRMAHYQHAKGFIELCDSLGMYVGEEVSIGGAGNSIFDPSNAGAVLVRSYETVNRDLNNPSIIYWSIGNEDPLASLSLNAIKYVKALDPTRPVLVPWRHETWLPKEIDILSVHYWHAHEYEQLASQSSRPIITTEYSHAFGTDGFGGLESRWKALTKHPEGTGGAVWMWADQGIKTPIKRPSSKYDKIVKDDPYLRIDDQGWDGIVDSYRKPTRDYWEVKAVYAQVYPTVDKVSFTPSQNVVTIPLQNDFDFTDLSKIKVEWAIFEDGTKLDSGIAHIAGLAHTVSFLELPISKLKQINSNKTYYTWLNFKMPSGTSIICKSVELVPILEKQISKPTASKINVIKSDADKITINVQQIQYVFNTTTGQLATAAIGKEVLLTDLKPVIWHTLDRGEASVIGSKIAGKLPDLNLFSSVKATHWNLKEETNCIAIEVEVLYTVNEKNQFIVNYQYRIDLLGHLTVHYEIKPTVETPNLPIVGMVFQSANELDKLHWLGLGPYDAYPNKQAAAILGFWGGSTQSHEVQGNKATRSIALSGLKHNVHIQHNGFVAHSVTNPNKVQLLSAMLGKPEKGRKPFESHLLLETVKGKTFVGEFSIALLGEEKSN